MSLFSRVRRTRTAKMTTRQVKDQFIRELTSEANNVIRQMTQQFARELQSQASNTSRGGGGGVSSSSFDAAAQVIAASTAPFLNSTHTRTESSDSARSQEVDARFRLSQSQALAEANLAISKGDKNL